MRLAPSKEPGECSVAPGLFARGGPNGGSKKDDRPWTQQDRARVAKAQDYEVHYEAKKTGRSAPAVKKAVKKVGNSRKRVENCLGR